MADSGLPEQWWPESEEAAVQPLTNVFNVSNVSKFDDNFDGTAKEEDEILHETSASEAEIEESYDNFGEVVEEETIELDFEKVNPKLVTHSMHCPNCKLEITKVILRRKVIAYRETGSDPVEPRLEQKDLVGCCSCLSWFTCSESCFSMLWAVGKKQKDLKLEDPPKSDPVLNPKLEDYYKPEPFYVNRQSIINFGQVQPPKYVTKTTSIPKDSFRLFSSDFPESSNSRGDSDTTIIVENAPETVVVAQSRGRSIGYEGVFVEILKSIVYGGLTEVIASLSVVASAAASYAVALCIVSMALANLIGGVFIIGHNLWDLRTDCYKYNSSQQTTKSATKKYKELLGQVNHFPLHAFFAILSFLVFGLVPPVTYGYSFYKTNGKDFSLMVTAIVSYICVVLLTMIKAYNNKCTVCDYFKMVVYYIIIAVLVSVASYGVGNLFAGLLENLGWFNTSSGGGDVPCLPRAIVLDLEAF